MFVSGGDPISIAFAKKLVSVSVAAHGPPSAVATWPSYGPPAPVVHKLIPSRGGGPAELLCCAAAAGRLPCTCVRALEPARAEGMDERVSRAREP